MCAFRFAGSCSLLVSQWSVDARATTVLMEEIFHRYGKRPSLSSTGKCPSGQHARPARRYSQRAESPLFCFPLRVGTRV
ncbi:MAG: hypothetical protein KF682_02770 [Nitrospira sp.]|nr:hypothetical protein [Nitrospira sp.]